MSSPWWGRPCRPCGSDVRQQLLDVARVGGIDDGVLAQVALLLARLAAQLMAQVRLTSDDLAGPGLLEALGGAAVGLQLGHELSSMGFRPPGGGPLRRSAGR